MQQIIINGGKQLCGEIDIPVAKNSVLPILAASVLCTGKTIIRKAPHLTDVLSCIKILNSIGMTAQFENGDVVVAPNNQIESCISNELMQSMRSSIFFIAPILTRCKTVTLTHPGGCKLGERPIDIHLDGLSAMGAGVEMKPDGTVVCNAPYGLCGTYFKLKLPSVGATETLMMAAATARGKTTLENVASEPEIEDLAAFLNANGAKVRGAGSKIITITGVEKLCGCAYTPIPDRITAATVMCAVAICGGDVFIKSNRPFHLSRLVEALSLAGARITSQNGGIRIISDGNLKGIGYLATGAYPMLATDTAPLLAASLLKSCGYTFLKDTIFENRFACAEGFKALGGGVCVKGTAIEINGEQKLYGNNLYAQDLRGGAALVIAALACEGQSKITGCEFINRGYEDISWLFRKLGADIIMKNI